MHINSQLTNVMQEIPLEEDQQQQQQQINNKIILNRENSFDVIGSDENNSNNNKQDELNNYNFTNSQLVLKEVNRTSTLNDQLNGLKISAETVTQNKSNFSKNNKSDDLVNKKKSFKKHHQSKTEGCIHNHKSDVIEQKFNMNYTNQSHSPGKALFEGIFGCIRPIINFWSTTKSNINQNLKDNDSEDFEVPFESLTNLQWLGSGAQGCVFKGLLNNEEVAIKKVKSKEETNISKLRKLNHPNLVKFKGVSLNGDKFFCIIMEFCPYGQLFTYLNNTKQKSILRPAKMMDWAKQIAKGMHYLHNNKIIHRDLKSPKYF